MTTILLLGHFNKDVCYIGIRFVRKFNIEAFGMWAQSSLVLCTREIMMLIVAVLMCLSRSFNAFQECFAYPSTDHLFC